MLKRTDRTAADSIYTIRETLTGIVIAFVMAFVFRGFVIEGFVIPTGSMAPTLMGKHMRVRSDASGYDWAVGPWDYYGNNMGNPPMPRQGVQQTTSNGRMTNPIVLHDPMTGAETGGQDLPLRAGDRVFVFKYLPWLNEPQRWDVVVFKNPSTQENYIKRLLGKPGEQLALVDGDLFTRPFADGMARKGAAAWGEDGWAVRRKPERVQRVAWQPVFDSRYTPLEPEPNYRSPWEGGGETSGRWKGLAGSQASGVYRYEGSAMGRATLAWSARHAISDRGAYNERPAGAGVVGQRQVFPVSDIATGLTIEADDELKHISVRLEARGHEFEALLLVSQAADVLDVAVRMRPHTPAGQPAGETTTLDYAEIKIKKPLGPMRVDFWHVDQALWLFVDGTLVCGGVEDGAYELLPTQRVRAVTGRTLDDLLAHSRYGNGITTAGALSDTSLYRRPKLAWHFDTGGSFALRDVTLARDIHYQVAPRNGTLGGHPDHFPTLSGEQYFMCGDNSPSSLDSRLWKLGESGPDPWIASQVDPGVPSNNPRELNDEQAAELRRVVGTVHRDLLIGRAFVVYFPAAYRVGRVPVPDAGRVRWVW